MDTRLLPLGTTRSGVPVYPIEGAMEVEPDEPDDEPQDEDEEPQDDPEGSGDGKKDKGKKSDRYVPPTEAEWARVRSSLDRSNASAKAKRERAQALEKENAELRDRVAAIEAAEERRKLLEQQRPPASADTGGGKGRNRNTPSAPPTPTDLPAGVLTPAQVRQQVAQAKREEREAVAAEYLDVAKRSAAKVALSDAQVPRASLSKLIRLIDLDEIELDQDGEVVGGLDEQVEGLKADFPQLFASAPAAEPEPPKKQTPRPRPPRIPNANGSGRQPAPERKLSTAERMAADILGER